MKKIDFVIRTLKEMQLNYNFQYPKEVPDMALVINKIEEEIHKK